jgi:hypothetical protein
LWRHMTPSRDTPHVDMYVDIHGDIPGDIPQGYPRQLIPGVLTSAGHHVAVTRAARSTSPGRPRGEDEAHALDEIDRHRENEVAQHENASFEPGAFSILNHQVIDDGAESNDDNLQLGE